MATTPPRSFYAIWQDEHIRDTLFEYLPKEDLCSFRLASSACCNVITKRLFTRITVTFTANTFTKPCRVQALSRIGHHIEHLSFHLAHSSATFLPPLIHPLTGHEISFLYTPHTSMASVLSRPKYANTELGEILTQQYPPLFHAATNVPSFINALKHVPSLRHLTIRCPGQDPQERYRRDIVDYALMSLRIAVERVQLTKLTKLSLSSLHPSALNYLRHVPGFGAVPSAARRWRQIRKLHMSVEAWDFYSPSSPGLDHLKILDDYVRNFAPHLEKFTFSWLGRKGPCPLALAADPLFAAPRRSRKLFNEVTTPMSPLPLPPSGVRRPIWFPRLRHLQVRNATMNAGQLADLVAAHQATVKEFDFENVALIGGGSWDDALAPLMEGSNRSEVWSRRSVGGASDAAGSVGGCANSGLMEPMSLAHEELPSPSAAVAAASRELLELDLALGEFGFAESDLTRSNSNSSSSSGAGPGTGLDVHGAEDELPLGPEDDLASDIAAAREASLSFSTNLRKKRLVKRRRKRRHHHEDEDEGVVLEDHHHNHHHQHQHRSRSRSRHEKSHRSKSRSRHHHRHHRHEHQGSSSSSSQQPSANPTPTPARRPLRERKDSGVGLEEDDELSLYPRPLTPKPLGASLPSAAATSASLSSSTTVPAPAPTQMPIPIPIPDAQITAPLLRDPQPVLLQPTVYDPATRHRGASGGRASPDDGISTVQRNIEAEESQRLLAENDSLRLSALRKAKEAVLTKLGREFGRRRVTPPEVRETPLRFPHGLFAAKSSLSVVVPDQRGLESQSALVPIMFGRC